MRRHGVLRHVENSGDFAGCDPVGLMHDDELERIHASRLCKSRKGFDGAIFFHISGFTDIMLGRQGSSARVAAMGGIFGLRPPDLPDCRDSDAWEASAA